MKQEWDELSDADRLAFGAWRDEQRGKAAGPVKQYADMTDAERVQFFRRNGMAVPSWHEMQRDRRAKR